MSLAILLRLTKYKGDHRFRTLFLLLALLPDALDTLLGAFFGVACSASSLLLSLSGLP